MNSTVEDYYASQLGHVLQVLSRTQRKTLSISVIEAFVLPAVRLRQIRIWFDHRGRAIAYLTWAFLSDSVSHDIENGLDPLLHISEWNEGANLWILDLVSAEGGLWNIINDLRNFEFLQRYSVVRAMRREKNGRGIKTLSIDLQRRRQRLLTTSGR